MSELTFAEKILGSRAGSIVFREPDIVLTHDNTASIENTFRKMGGTRVSNPDQLLVVLDHNAPPTNSKLANDYEQIRRFVKDQGIRRFHDAGEGICHQLMEQYAEPGMIIVGSDSHTCTAGAFNAFAVGIDRTETAGIWKQGETWFRVPESIRITLTGSLPANVYAKDLALYIIGMIGSSGADYYSIEFHGPGVSSLDMASRMTVANMASEMGAKNAVFPADEVSRKSGRTGKPVWADRGALYAKDFAVDLSGLFPLVAIPHHVDHVKSVHEQSGQAIRQALIGTCTNGRIEDLRVAAAILRGNHVAEGVQLLITPASRAIYLQAVQEGLAEIFLQAGANILTPSCGPCLGTGQGIPADADVVISTANRNFLGRMGNPRSIIYLASPATVAISAIRGTIHSPEDNSVPRQFPFHAEQSSVVKIAPEDDRYAGGVWDYSDADNINTDQMFAGNLTYEIGSNRGDQIVPHLFRDFDESFSPRVTRGDVLICGKNFGCGSSREHPSVGFVYAGVQAILVKSVSRIFFRSAVNQGLPILVVPDAVDAYKRGDKVTVDFAEGLVTVCDRDYFFEPLPGKLLQIIGQGGLINWIIGKE